MNNIAIIFARDGPHRIAPENILSFRGRPTSGWMIEAVLEGGLFDTDWVSTDDAKIPEIMRTVFKAAPSNVIG